ncbi:MAG: FAD:protein FMN transferase [Treponema sp.]|jgi:thiamine biosynthesis lipoprotein|nr:FAD:protein FMN transferase [Treponema sp.]
MNAVRGAALGAVLMVLFSCAPLPPQSEEAFGTVCTVNLYNAGTHSVYNAIFSRFREIEDHMSLNKDGSEIDAVNAAAGVTPARVSEDVFEVVDASLRYAEISDGAFDPSVGALVKLWGIGSDGARAPAQEEIDAVLPLVNYRNVTLDRDKQTVFLSRPGMTLDLGGIAKGYAADEAVKIIKKRGIQAALIDLGGNIFVYGKRNGKKTWRIGVQDPLGERNKGLGIVEIEGDATLVTSGVYERFLEIDGKRYHHILSTRDGRPVNNGLLSTTIIAKTSMDADALSTAVFALGYEKGVALVKSLAPSLGVEAIFVFEDKTVRTTANTAFARSARFTLTGAGYTLE